VHFHLYNTMTKRVEPFVPADPNEITFYTCGPTVYDDAHIGNFRSFLAADLLRRWLESPLCVLETPGGTPHAGPRRVHHVMNITDVGHMTDDADADGGGEDKMMAAEKRIIEAKKSGKLPPDAKVDPSDPFAVADFYRARFIEDARALGLKVAEQTDADPSLMPRATDHIDGMKRVIARLIDEGVAYPAGQPGKRAVYFDVQKAHHYGRLSGNTLDRLRGGAGGRVDDTTQSEKHHPADFLLWKEDASHKMKWPSPEHPALAGWGDGYPGWHIECTAMSLERLVHGGLDAARHHHAEIDLHSGGEDNIFPHHECEIAQSCAFTQAPRFARHWFHPRFLMVEGQKMSKSKGTFHTPRDLITKGIDPAAIRLELIKTHYRANADFSMQGLKDSARTIERWRQFRASAADGPDGDASPGIRDEVARALSDDLNIAGAIGAINKWINATASPTKGDAALFDQLDQILGVLGLKQAQAQDTGIAVYLPGAAPSDEVEQLLAQRRDAKKAKDFARADAIRDQLTQMGYAVKDIAGGKVEVAPIN
jgi:cysteinyl-tRNA synthetase